MKYSLHLMIAAITFFAGSTVAAGMASAQGFSESETMETVWIEEMTWGEIQGSMKFGYNNIIIPAAGIEQNGPHVPLNKHRLVVKNNANAIARRLGNTLVAPVIDFVPEGNIETREGHMNFAGTISMPGKVFADIIDYTVRSLGKHGFKQFFLIGDSGSTQQVQEQVAKALRKQGYAVYQIGDYYANVKQEELLRKKGYTAETIGGHAGLRDTSEFMAVAPGKTREYQLGVIPESDFYQYGAWGDTSRATPQLGKALAKVKVDLAVAQICRDSANKPNNCRR